MTGDGKHSTHKSGDDLGMVYGTGFTTLTEFYGNKSHIPRLNCHWCSIPFGNLTQRLKIAHLQILNPIKHSEYIVIFQFANCFSVLEAKSQLQIIVLMKSQTCLVKSPLSNLVSHGLFFWVPHFRKPPFVLPNFQAHVMIGKHAGLCRGHRWRHTVQQQSTGLI